MSMKVLLAGIAGGIAMFIWASVVHMSPIGHVGLSRLDPATEPAALSALQAAGGGVSRLFMLPGFDLAAPDRDTEMKRWQDKTRTGPSGLLLYHPAGQARDMTAMTLVLEAAKEIVLSVLAAVLVGLSGITGYVRRVGFVALVGLTAVLTTHPSNWIWYGYPTDFIAANMFMEWGGFVVAGLVIATVLRPKRGGLSA